MLRLNFRNFFFVKYFCDFDVTLFSYNNYFKIFRVKFCYFFWIKKFKEFENIIKLFK